MDSKTHLKHLKELKEQKTVLGKAEYSKRYEKWGEEVPTQIDFDNKAFLKRLKGLRGKERLTQIELAKLSGTSQSAISDLEKGVATPTILQLLRLSNLFDVSVDWLVGNVSSKQNTNRLTTRDFCEVLARIALENKSFLHIEIKEENGFEQPFISFVDGDRSEIIGNSLTIPKEINRFIINFKKVLKHRDEGVDQESINRLIDSHLRDITIDWLFGNVSSKQNTNRLTTRDFCEMLARMALENKSFLHIEVKIENGIEQPFISFKDVGNKNELFNELFGDMVTISEEINRFIIGLEKVQEQYHKDSISPEIIKELLDNYLRYVSDV